MATHFKLFVGALAVGLAFTLACGGSTTPGRDWGNGGDEDISDESINPDHSTTPDADSKEPRPDDGKIDTPPEEVKEETEQPDLPPEVDIDAELPPDPKCTRDEDCPNASNGCELGKCNDGVCGLVDKDCSDGLECTEDSCDSNNGQCYWMYIPGKPCEGCAVDSDCRITDPCFSHRCVPCPIADGAILDRFDCPASGNVCSRVECPDCDDGNPCTIDSCDSEGVVSNVEKSCTDYDPCTADYCDQTTGECVHMPVAGDCVPCAMGDDAACNTVENNPSPNCLIGKCVEIKLEGGSVPCGAGNTCPGGGRCDTQLGVCMTNICDYEPVNCEDGNACTKNECIEEMGGCQSTCICTFGCTTESDDSEECDDGNPCTTDMCISGAGAGSCAGTLPLFCYNEPVDCDDGDPLTLDYCDTELGTCVNLPKVFDCLDDATCQNVQNKCTTDEYCDGVTLTCQFRAVDCNDRDPCTQDSCDPRIGCVHTPILGCGDDEPCTTDAMCDDGNECTIDSCVADPNNPDKSYCKHLDRVCDEAPKCHKGTCVPGKGCVYLPVPDCQCSAHSDCMAENMCSVGRCNFSTGQCFYEEKNCDDNDPCTLDSCDPASGACINTIDPYAPPQTCTDCSRGGVQTCRNIMSSIFQDKCLEPVCNKDTHRCEFPTKQCPTTDPCFPGSCNPATGQCENTKIPNCQKCSRDTDCSNPPNACKYGKCNTGEGVCEWLDLVCESTNPCTVGRCDPSDPRNPCKYDPKDCDDNNACTTDTCKPNVPEAVSTPRRFVMTA